MRAGDHHVGIRCDDRGVLEELSARYARRLVPDDRGELDFGLSVAEVPQPSGARLLPSLVHGRRPVLRTRDRDRLLHRLAVELGTLDGWPPPHTIPLSGVGALCCDGGAVIVPAEVFGAASVLERAVAAGGADIAEPVGLALALDAGGPALLVPPPLDGVRPAGVAGPGALRLVAWAGDRAREEDRPATALVRILRHVVGAQGAPRLSSALLAELAGLARSQVGGPTVLGGPRVDVSEVLARLGSAA